MENNNNNTYNILSTLQHNYKCSLTFSFDSDIIHMNLKSVFNI